MGTILIVCSFVVALAVTNSVGLLLFLREHRLRCAVSQALAFATESAVTQIKAKDEEIQALKAQLALAEGRAIKLAVNIVRAKNWRQVLSLNDRERAEQEYEEEVKHANTQRR